MPNPPDLADLEPCRRAGDPLAVRIDELAAQGDASVEIAPWRRPV